MWLLRRAQFSKAEPYFRKAVETLTERNPNPYDGEPYFNLGTSLMMQERFDEAYEAFFKSAWNAAWQDAAYLNLARIATRRGDWQEALNLIDKSLVRNYHSHTARHLKSAILQARPYRSRQQLDQRITGTRQIQLRLFIRAIFRP